MLQINVKVVKSQHSDRIEQSNKIYYTIHFKAGIGYSETK